MTKTLKEMQADLFENEQGSSKIEQDITNGFFNTIYQISRTSAIKDRIVSFVESEIEECLETKNLEKILHLASLLHKTEEGTQKNAIILAKVMSNIVIAKKSN